jgi:hypothetical protein
LKPFAVDLHENFIDEKGISISSMLPLQISSVKSAELDAPQPDRLTAVGNSTLG